MSLRIRNCIFVKLIHPEMGEVAVRKVLASTHIKWVVNGWKCRYGKKFHECKVEIERIEKEREVFEKDKPDHLKKLQNIETGEIYENQKAACKALNLSTETIRNHAKKKLRGRFNYIVKYAE